MYGVEAVVSTLLDFIFVRNATRAGMKGRKSPLTVNQGHNTTLMYNVTTTYLRPPPSGVVSLMVVTTTKCGVPTTLTFRDLGKRCFRATWVVWLLDVVGTGS